MITSVVTIPCRKPEASSPACDNSAATRLNRRRLIDTSTVTTKQNRITNSTATLSTN